MKNAISISIILLIPFVGFSQHQNLKNAKAIYAFAHIKDTNNVDNIYKEDMMLTFNANASSYKSYTLFYNDSIFDRRVMEKTYNGATTAKITKATYDQHLYFFSDNSHYLVQPWIGDTLVIKDEIDHIDWTITNEKKDIAGFNSIKATCHFKGRQYEAWYCPDIAVKAGPWKLNGLPGLILEAIDSKAHVKFEIISLQNLPMAMVSLPTTKKLITKQEFEQMKNALKQNPGAFLNAANAANTSGALGLSSSVELSKTMNSGATKNPKSISRNNNPLELSN